MNIIQRAEGIVKAAINLVWLIFTIVLLEVLFELMTKREQIVDVISWMTEPSWKKFHKSLQPEAGNQFTRIRSISARLTLLHIRLYDVISCIGSLALSAIMQCIPSMRYQLPLPWHVPVADYKNWTVFSIGFFIQTTCFFFMGQIISFFVSFIFVFYLHVNEYMNIILKGFTKLNQNLRDNEVRSRLNVDESLLILVKMIVDCVR